MLEWLQPLDGNFLLWLQGLRVPVLNLLLSTYTTLGNHGLLFIGISAAMLLYRPTRKAGALALASMALGFLCTNVVLKHLVGRPRPWLDIVGLIPLVEEPDPNSFPSGHSCAAFAAGISWFLGIPNHWIKGISVVMAVGMAFSRLYVGVHYPSDVLCGSLIGAGCAWLVWKLWTNWSAHRPSFQ